MDDAKKARETQVQRALMEQAKSIECLGETINRLFERLKPLLRDEPVATSDKSPADEIYVPLVCEISSRTGRIDSINRQATTIYELCEL